MESRTASGSPSRKVKAHRVSKTARRRQAAKRVDNRALEATLIGTSLLMWVPYSLAALYVAYCRSFFLETESDGVPTAARRPSTVLSFVSSSSLAATLGKSRLSHPYNQFYYYIFPEGFDIAVYVPLVLRVLAFSAVSIGLTYYFAVKKAENGGEYLMVLAWVIGVLSESFWLTSPIDTSASMHVKTAVAASTASADSAEAQLVLYDYRIPTPPGWLWLVVSICTGILGGILDKVKDISEGKLDREKHLFTLFEREEEDVEEDGAEPQRRPGRRSRRRQVGVQSHSNFIGFGERLYMVVPFCTGQWFCFILQHGWRGIIVENGVIVMSMGMIGYTMLSYKILRRQVFAAVRRTPRRVAVVHQVRRMPTDVAGAPGSAAASGTASPAPSGAGTDDATGASERVVEEVYTTIVEDEEEDLASVDVIDLISKIFTTSFGVVVVVVLVVNLFVTSLAIPFLKALSSLNALVSSVGIIFELIMYEVV